MRTAALTLFLLAPSFAVANQTARVLDLCLDTNETPETRIALLETEGWERGGDALTALTVAFTILRLNPGDPTNWQADREVSSIKAQEALDDEADTHMLRSSDGHSVVFVGRNIIGLQTCLFLGPQDDLDPIVEVLEGKTPSTIKTVSRLRGEAYKSLISAHAMNAEGRAQFDPPLAYGMSFAVQLDRQPGEESLLRIPKYRR